mmetsp:Transcript_80747/g.160017  ORF Transcript_80747/g.160017 Transcript_80747/m.160017 type:complete len:342 (+) Transcript_80747:212-1237(+)
MITVDVLNLLVIQQLQVDKLRLDGYQGQLLKPKILLLTKVAWRLPFNDHHEVFYPDPELSVFVIAWFVAYNHAGLKWCPVVILLCDALRTLMHAKGSTDTVASAVAVIEACSPEWSPCICIQNKAWCALRKNGSSERNVPFEHSSETISFMLCGVSKFEGASHVRSAVKVLPTRVHEQQLRGAKCSCCGSLGSIVYDCAVFAITCNGIKGIVKIAPLCCTLTGDLVIDMNFGHGLRCSNAELQLCERSSQSCSVAPVCFAHAVKLAHILSSFHRCDGRWLCDPGLCPTECLLDCEIGAVWVKPDLLALCPKVCDCRKRGTVRPNLTACPFQVHHHVLRQLL